MTVEVTDALGVVAFVDPFDWSSGDPRIRVEVEDHPSLRAALDLAWSALDAADDADTLESLGGTDDDRRLAMDFIRALMTEA